MTRIRLLYLYVLSTVALGMLLFGLSHLLGAVLDRIIDNRGETIFASGDDSLRLLVARYVAISVIALPVWLGHWYVAQRGATAETPRGREERFAPERRFFLAVIIALVTGLPAVVAAWNVLEGLAGRLLGMGDPPRIAGALATLVVTGGAWVYFRGVQRADVARDPALIEIDDWRRLEIYGLAVAGLFVFTNGLDALLDVLIRLVGDARADVVILTADRWWAGPLAGALASIAVGAGLWAIHWLPVTALAGRDTPAGLVERHSLVRRFARAGILLVTLVIALTQAGIALAAVLAWAFGVAPGEIDLPGDGDTLMTTLAHAALTGLVYGAIWCYLAERSRQEEPALDPESPDVGRADPQRIYAYLVALVGLGFFVGGGIQIISILADVLRDRTPILSADDDTWRRPLATAIASLVVGFAAWVWEWNRAQRRAASAAIEDADALAPVPAPVPAERRSPVRRAYLVIAAGIGLIILLGSGSIALYALLGTLLSVQDDVGERFADVAGWLVGGAFLVAYHVAILRSDGQMSRAAPDEEGPAQTIDLPLILTLPGGTDLEPVLARLRGALPPDATIGRAAVEGSEGADGLERT